MSRAASRARAEQAVILRARQRTLQEIADELGFASRGAARTAIENQLARTSPEATPEAIRRYLLESAAYTSRRWHDKFDDACKARDIEAMTQAHRGLCRDRDQVARLTGAYAPEKTEVNVRVSASAIIANTRERLLAVLDAEIVEEPTREIAP